MKTSTMGANMRYTINGAAPTSTSGTLISASSWPVTVTPSPGGTTLRVIAYKAGMIDSQVHEAAFYYENDNGGMAQPVDGDPGGGGILIDGGNQPTISYDANGNLTKYKGWTYSYDAQNRLISASNGTTNAQFYYDGKNRQIARNINGVIRFNSWDGWELLEEYSSSLNVATGYLQGSTGAIKSWSAANTLYYYQDKLGSTTHVANAIGQLVESFHYDLTGTPTETSTHGVVDLYAGERWIPELRLYDLRNRFMSPELGRFLQTDPMGLQTEGEKLSAGQKALFSPGGSAPEAFSSTEMNLFRYCGDDPVLGSDPLGLEDQKLDPKEIKKAEGLLRNLEKGAREDHTTATQTQYKDGTTSVVVKAKEQATFRSAQFIRDHSTEEMPGSKYTVSIASHFHADAMKRATPLPSEDRDLKTGRKIFILFGSDTLKKESRSILIVPHVNPNEQPSQYVRPMTYAP